MIAAALPREAEAQGLLALLLFHRARESARAVDGELVLLGEQDRSRWDAALLAEARRALERAAMLRRPGRWQLHAAIAACHADARDARTTTDWLQVLTLYDMLLAYDRSPVVRLNRAVALARVEGPAAALAEVDALEDALARFHLWHAVRAQLLRELGRDDEALAADLRALELTANDAERRLIAGRLARLTAAMLRCRARRRRSIARTVGSASADRRGVATPTASGADGGERVRDEPLERRHPVARQDRLEVALHRGVARVRAARRRRPIRIGGDLGLADPRRAGRDARGEGVVEADGCRRPEHVDGLLQALVRRGERGEVDAERVGEDLVAEADREERPAGRAAVRDDLAHAPHPRARRVRAGRRGPGPQTTRSASSSCASVTRAPRHDLDLEAEVAQLVGEHRGEPVLGVDHDRGPAGERTGAGGILRIQPERGEPGVARGEQRGDGRVVGEQARARRRGVLVDRASSIAASATRRAAPRRSRRARPRPCRASR